VWCRNIDRIPGHHGFSVFPQDAGRVVEMNGYSPPRREVAPPPECLRYDSLIHIDLVEDWTVHEARTPPPGQSGAPSSTSSDTPRCSHTPGALGCRTARKGTTTAAV
jgi:hypothetical protein